MRYVLAVMLFGGVARAQDGGVRLDPMTESYLVHMCDQEANSAAAAQGTPIQRPSIQRLVACQARQNASRQEAMTRKRQQIEQQRLRDEEISRRRQEDRDRQEWQAAQEELAKEANQKREAENERRIDAIRANRKQMAAVFGAIFCSLKNYRAGAIAEIAKEKKYARYGGMVDKRKLYQLQQHIRRVDEIEAEKRSDLKDWKSLAPAACSDALVRRVVACNTGGECDQLTTDMATFVPDDPVSDDDE